MPFTTFTSERSIPVLIQVLKGIFNFIIPPVSDFILISVATPFSFFAEIRKAPSALKVLKETFFPSYYIRENFSMLHHLEQGNKSVEEYAREFKVYAMKCGVNKDETQTLVRFSSQYLRVGLQK